MKTPFEWLLFQTAREVEMWDGNFAIETGAYPDA